jgi:hypothetical protein
MLTWQPANDNVNPAGHDHLRHLLRSHPRRGGLHPPNLDHHARSDRFRTPGLPSHGDAYFVVRVRDTAGNEDTNTRSKTGVDPCL